MWAASIVEALNLDPFVRTRLVGYHASVGRLVALVMLTHVSRLLQGRELPGSILPYTLTGRELPPSAFRGLF